MVQVLDAEEAAIARPYTDTPIIDTDVHPAASQGDRKAVLAYLPQRWRDYVDELGFQHGGGWPGGERIRQREFAARMDAKPPSGGAPASDPNFAREQLLDKYGITAAILNSLVSRTGICGIGRQPVDFSAAYCRALNQVARDRWFDHDPRWYGSIVIPHELPDLAVGEIQFCMDEMPGYRSRWKQVMLTPNNGRGAGHPSYWPIYEAAEHYGLVVGFHVIGLNQVTPSGWPTYYYEEHCDYGGLNFPLVSSLIFEGVFERFPRLRIALVELGWTWAVPLAWRLDHAYRVLGHEVPQLTRRPSEYLRDHFWYTTQPMEEPDNPRWMSGVFEQWEASGMGDKLMFSSDYPHWDFDEPSAIPRSAMSDEQIRRIMCENASALYDIALSSVP